MEKPKLASVSVECMVSWATQFPDLFLQTIEKFRVKYPNESFRHKIRLDRPGYVVLVAVAR